MGVTRILTGLACAGVLVLAGCSSDPDPTTSETGAGPTATAEQPAEEPTGGDIDPAAACQVSQEDLAKWTVAVQILAQINPGTLDLVREGTLDLNLDEFDATTNALRQIADADTGGLGDPGEALDYYTNLSQAARAVIAKGGDVTDADLSQYEETAGDPADVIGKQIAISAAYQEVCG